MTSPPQSHPNPSINSLTEQMMEEKRINTKQQQQMATSFKGATDVASEVRGHDHEQIEDCNGGDQSPE
jgi:hypothetical protein